MKLAEAVTTTDFVPWSRKWIKFDDVLSERETHGPVNVTENSE
jgi:hypothetical protein